MEKIYKFCQSCGMPMKKDEKGGGTNADGSKNVTNSAMKYDYITEYSYGIAESLNLIAEKYDYPIIVSTHPRTRNMIDSKQIKMHPNVQFLKPMGFFDYIKLQQNAKCVISDSGTITEEASILAFPAIMIRSAHERPEGMDEGTVIMSGLGQDRILESIRVVTSQFEDSSNKFRIINDYNVENVSIKVVRIILSYIDFVNRTVWKKDTVKKQFYKV